MKGMIRWQGLGVFCFFVAIISLFTLFFADGLIKKVIETQGSKMVGARVDLAEAKLSFFPAGLTLTGLQITNPERPWQNIIEIDRLAMGLDPMHFLQRKIIIEEMTATGIRPDTPRKNSGAMPELSALAKSAAPDETESGLKIPTFKMPDVKEILAKEDLATITMASEFQQQIKADSANWRKKLAELPNEEKLGQYRARLTKVKSSSGLAGILGGATDLLAIQKEIKNDLNLLKARQREFAAVSASYQHSLTKLQQAPQQDIKRLSAKYSLSADGLANLSPLLFGDKARRMTKQALVWYAKTQPILARVKDRKNGNDIVRPARGKGVMVRFREDAPLPDFLIRNIAASGQIAQGNFAGTIKNVTPDQDVLGVPLSFAFAGKSLQGLRAISFHGVLDHTNPSLPRDSINVEIEDYSLARARSGEDQTTPATISGGLLDLSAQAVLQQEDITAAIEAKLKEAEFTPDPGQQSDVTSRIIAEAMSKTNTFSVRAKVSGTIASYKIKIDSDLDKILKEAVAATIKTQTAKFEQQLNTGIMAKVKGPLAAAKGSYADFGDIAKELTSRMEAGDRLL